MRRRLLDPGGIPKSKKANANIYMVKYGLVFEWTCLNEA